MMGSGNDAGFRCLQYRTLGGKQKRLPKGILNILTAVLKMKSPFTITARGF